MISDTFQRFAEYAPFVEKSRPPRERKSEMEWRAVLDRDAFASLRQRRKEKVGEGKYTV
jgi:hypothetical protein